MLLYLFAALFFPIIQCGNIPAKNLKIVGGKPADMKEAPYQVALLYGAVGSSQFTQSCGGSIIKANVIVSAAHCSHKTTPAQWKARADSTLSTSGGQLKDVSKLVSHPNFNANTVDYDISLYILSSPLTLGSISPKSVPLPAQNSAVKDGAIALVTGWGSVVEGGNPSISLQKITIPIVNQKTCEAAYKGINAVTARMLCAGLYDTGGQSTCQRDSGGPLTINGVLIGITSWGNGCGLPKFPGVYTRVPSFRTWIDQQS